MAGGVSVSVTLSSTWRDVAGRFARPPVGDSIDAQLHKLGQDAVRMLANATPVRTGAMRQGWRSTAVPSQHAERITNTAPYAWYVAWGTRYQPANSNLQRTIAQELPAMAEVTAGQALKDIAAKLKG